MQKIVDALPPFVYSPLLKKEKALFHCFGTKHAPLDAEGRTLFSGAGIYLKQTHGREVLVLTKSFDEGLHLLGEADGLVTNIKNLSLLIKTADCMPIAIYDPVKKVVAALHGGWRSTLAGIFGVALEKMAQNFSSKPQDLLVAVGPSISYDYFEVGQEVVEAFKEAYVFMEKGLHYKPAIEEGKYFLDLKAVLKSHALSLGVLEKNIDLLNYCTYSQADLFYSYRRAKEPSRLWLRLYLI